LRSRGRFAYRPYRTYAAISTLRVMPWVVLIVIMAWGEIEWSLRSQAQEIVDGLSADRTIGGSAVFRLWTTSPSVRSRFLDILMNSPGRLEGGGTDWVSGYVSLETDTAAHLARRLRSRLDRVPATETALEQSLLAALGTAAGRLKDTDAKEVATDLRARLDRPGVDRTTQRSLLDALAMAAAATAHGATSVRDLAVSVGVPLREQRDSPAWPILEKIAGAIFEHDFVPLMAWARDAYGIKPTEARPAVHR
jgi:hypothetical protein